MDATRTNRPVWVDLTSQDPEGSRAFYTALFGWVAEPSADPQYGGYAVATLGGKDVAGIAPAQSADQPTAWMVHIGTADIDALAASIPAAGGTLVMPPFPVGEMGRLTVFQDPSGAFLSAWQGRSMPGFTASGAGAFTWAELNARGLDAALPFYATVFGWGAHASEMAGGMRYVEFQEGGQSVAGAMEMSPMVPAFVPSYWGVYFGVDDLEAMHARALELGAHEMLGPTAFGGGRFSILSDPQGASLGLLRMG